MTDERDHDKNPLPAEAAMRMKLSAIQLLLVANFLNEAVERWEKEQPGNPREANERIDYIANRLVSLANATITSANEYKLSESEQPFGSGWMASEAEMLALRRWMYKLTKEDFERHTDSPEAAQLAQSGMEKLRISFNNFELESSDEKSLYEGPNQQSYDD